MLSFDTVIKIILKYHPSRRKDTHMAVSEILAALADETRRTILTNLKEGPISAGDLAEYLGITPQALS